LSAATEITLPPFYKPRNYQQKLWDFLEAGGLRAACVWHRRAGKDISLLNFLSTRVYKRKGLYWMIYPTMAQGRKIAWEGMDKEGHPFLDAFPEEIRYRKRDDLMRLYLKDPVTGREGSSIQIVGTDNVDSLVGPNPLGLVFSEWSVCDPMSWELLRPILAENGGFAVFIYTPRGRNHGWRILQTARKNPRTWFSEVLTVDDTGVVSKEFIEEERAQGMPEEMIQQEYYCSFSAPLVGSYYGDLVEAMDDDNRIGKVDHDPNLDVDTFWDLGIGDTTAIWFHQQHGPERRLIDYEEASGVGIDYYAQLLQAKQYTYRRHYVPHDATSRSLQTGRTLVDMARDLGLKLTVVEKASPETGIQAVRAMLPMAWMDETKCERGIQALREYQKRAIQGVLDPEGQPVYGKDPAHTWASNAADALRTGAMGWRRSRNDHKGPLKPKLSIV
jgi:hypothetical protein